MRLMTLLRILSIFPLVSCDKANFEFYTAPVRRLKFAQCSHEISRLPDETIKEMACENAGKPKRCIFKAEYYDKLIKDRCGDPSKKR